MMEHLFDLLQYEVDQLDGILCTMRTVANQVFQWRSV